MKKIQSSFALVGLLATITCIAADPPAGTTTAESSDAGMFAKGMKQVSILGGTGDAFNDSYFILGVGGSYFIADGLSVGLHFETWMDGDPGIYKIAASMNYVFYKTPRISPYVGALYRYTEIEDLDSLSSVGGRAGAYLAAGRNGYFGLGVVYESYLDCDTHIYSSCDTTYPEVSFLFSF